jgi:hypothetical protein
MHGGQPSRLLQLKQQIIDQPSQLKALLRHRNRKELTGQQERLPVFQDQRPPVLVLPFLITQNNSPSDRT